MGSQQPGVENLNLLIALIYDFDGTLSPGNMQEYDFIPAVGKSNKEFWSEANSLAEEQDADMVLTYMARMIQAAKSKGPENSLDNQNWGNFELYLASWVRVVSTTAFQKRLDLIREQDGLSLL